MKKVDNNANFVAGGIISRRTHHNSLCGDKNKHWVISYVTNLQDNELIDATSHAQALPHS
jgi:hypothetical protein